MEKAQPRLIKFSDLVFLPRNEKPEMADLAEISGESDGTMLGTGFAKLKKARIEWTVKYDEVLLVLDGHVKVHTKQGVIEAHPKDCIWLPKDTPLIYEAESALIFYAIYPSNWATHSA